MNTIARLSVVLLGSVLAASASGDETQIKLTNAPELTLVRARCSGCHSLDYIQMNSPFLKRAVWEAEVRKMIKVMGAPMQEEDVGPIVDYLTKNYGIP
jgi:sulfite dehydrogenase (cytochrome) subunit B